ncbi:hypothetical protein EO93_02835 [Methanosarcina sp. 1.H.A.2.2]|nr:hypothetical protein EO93_02835 [Methanosarcina sp. 1.H.A.2.2]
MQDWFADFVLSVLQAGSCPVWRMGRKLKDSFLDSGIDQPINQEPPPQQEKNRIKPKKGKY